MFNIVDIAVYNLFVKIISGYVVCCVIIFDFRQNLMFIFIGIYLPIIILFLFFNI